MALKVVLGRLCREFLELEILGDACDAAPGVRILALWVMQETGRVDALECANGLVDPVSVKRRTMSVPWLGSFRSASIALAGSSESRQSRQ